MAFVIELKPAPGIRDELELLRDQDGTVATFETRELARGEVAARRLEGPVAIREQSMDEQIEDDFASGSDDDEEDEAIRLAKLLGMEPGGGDWGQVDPGDAEGALRALVGGEEAGPTAGLAAGNAMMFGFTLGVAAVLRDLRERRREAERHEDDFRLEVLNEVTIGAADVLVDEVELRARHPLVLPRLPRGMVVQVGPGRFEVGSDPEVENDDEDGGGGDSRVAAGAGADS